MKLKVPKLPEGYYFKVKTKEYTDGTTWVDIELVRKYTTTFLLVFHVSYSKTVDAGCFLILRGMSKEQLAISTQEMMRDMARKIYAPISPTILKVIEGKYLPNEEIG